MKARNLLLTTVLITLVMVAITGGAKKKLSMDEAYEILAGTWLNEEYSEMRRVYKYIIQPDGKFIAFTTVSSGESYSGQFTVLDTMIDSEGIIWIKEISKAKNFFNVIIDYEIQKHNSSNKTMEVFSSAREGWYGEGFPTDLEPGDHVRYMYRIYYRHE